MNKNKYLFMVRFKTYLKISHMIFYIHFEHFSLKRIHCTKLKYNVAIQHIIFYK